MDVDPELRQALIDPEDGLLRPGALPKMATSSAAGNKQLLDAIDKALPNPPLNQCHSGNVGHQTCGYSLSTGEAETFCFNSMSTFGANAYRIHLMCLANNIVTKL